MEFPTITRTITPEKMVRYSGVRGIHGNDAAARQIGLAGAIVQGGQLAGYLNEMLVAAFGRGYLEGGELSLSFVKSAKAGDVVTCHGESIGKRSVDGRTRIDCNVWLENQLGEKVTVGTASAYLE